MTHSEATAAIEAISIALLDEARDAISTGHANAAFNARSRFGGEASTGRKLARIGAALVALETIGRAF